MAMSVVAWPDEVEAIMAEQTSSDRQGRRGAADRRSSAPPQHGNEPQAMGYDDFERPAPLRPESDEPQELSFDDDDYTRDGRVGDRERDDVIAQQYPTRREATAGLTGAATPDRDVTADDLSPETLLDEDGARGELGDDPEMLAADQSLRTVDADEIGGGTGLDEEEQAHVERPERRLRPDAPLH